MLFTVWILRPTQRSIYCKDLCVFVDSANRIIGGRHNRYNGLTEYSDDRSYEDLDLLDKSRFVQIFGEWWI